MTAPLIVEDPAPHVRRLVLNRPEQLNTMTAELCEALHVELRRVAAERSVRAVIVTGAGRGFCAGLDLHGYGAAPGNEGERRTPQPPRQPAAHVEPDPRLAGAAPAGDRRRQRPGGRVRARAGARLRHPLRSRGGGLQGGVPEHRRIELRHGNELAAAAADRSIPIARADAHRAGASTPRRRCASGWSQTSSPPVSFRRGHSRAPARSQRSAPWGVRLTKQGMWAALEVSSERAAVEYEDRQQIMATFGSAPPEAVGAFLEKRPPSFED